MSDRPIIFSASMIRALIEGRKTQTRRILKLPTKGEYIRRDIGGWEPTTIGGNGCFTKARDGSDVPYPEHIAIWNRTTGTCVVTPWEAGANLWVREAFSYARLDIDHGSTLALWYWADGNPNDGDWTKPKPSIHMPRWASRLTLAVSDIRVQRLQDISEEDAIAEGVAHGSLIKGWDANPWVSAITFTVEQRNIDAGAAP